ncbi:Aim9p ASCRUDRAFT_39742 [Ascoidea rubescens DSM 1968]|uniref:Altered inheritance of mitochondria protein 9, mitochondrial n=1 Tax=Ascoidea rubescens DSM 1968 TaxID=1344418 RepID=A0A1D2V993_9ASCO|nr:hypothetical protein ASCRUDRAFT_39742 [Ascoidea rubescens DSM 1968]ODV58214.1 hypothetical protein ASCRUDRAFT_39742 [Ascoidea rubescens DSM 1968]
MLKHTLRSYNKSLRLNNFLRVSLKINEPSLISSSNFFNNSLPSIPSFSSSNYTKRFNSTDSKNTNLNSDEKENIKYIKLNEENDPEKDAFFQYTWGYWLKNDKQEKEKRITTFSFPGTAKLLEDLYSAIKENKNPETLESPVLNPDNTITLKQNIIPDVLGSLKDSNESLSIRTMSSHHEGKHHRIYKIDLNTGKSLILRIPYKIDSDFAISRKVDSEVATMDFARLKLGLNVPRVLSYSSHEINPLRTPYILMEYIEGDLLMKKWYPNIEDEEVNSREKLNEVIDILGNFQHKLNSIEFNQFGSIYFYKDVDINLRERGEPYNEEKPDELLFKNRWRIGPSVERNFFRNKKLVSSDVYKIYSGPWKIDEPYKIVDDSCNIEIENIRNRLSLSKSEASIENEKLLNNSIEVLEKLKKIAPNLIDNKSKTIPKIEKLFKGRLYSGDIDPLNVIIKEKGDGEIEPYFVDFEHFTIKPFIFTNNPLFIRHEGMKIFDLNQLGIELDKLSELDKRIYKDFYKKTRNEHLWEKKVNELDKDLIYYTAPVINELKSPYIKLINKKTDEDILDVEESLIKIATYWKNFLDSKLAKEIEEGNDECPIKWERQEVEEFYEDYENYKNKLIENPFAIDGGWVPRHTFETYFAKGIINKEGDDYVVNSNKLMEVI